MTEAGKTIPEKAGPYVLAAVAAVAIGGGGAYAAAEAFQTKVIAFHGGTQDLVAARGQLDPAAPKRFDAASVPEALQRWQYTATERYEGEDWHIAPHPANGDGKKVVDHEPEHYFVFSKAGDFYNQNVDGAKDADEARANKISTNDKRAAIGGAGIALVLGEWFVYRRRHPKAKQPKQPKAPKNRGRDAASPAKKEPRLQRSAGPFSDTTHTASSSDPGRQTERYQ